LVDSDEMFILFGGTAKKISPLHTHLILKVEEVPLHK
jgi:hypothetical protein